MEPEPRVLSRNHRIAALDGLRGIGAFSVMVFHFLDRGPSLFPEIGERSVWAQMGPYGIGLFFLVSGFVILMTMQRSTVKGFALSRFIRLYPAYWVCVILTFTVVLVAGLPGREVTWGEALINLTMLQSYLGVPPVDAAYWTLGVELAFYVQCLVLLAPGFVRGRALDVVMAVGLVISAATIVLDRVFGAPLTGGLLQAFGWTGYFVVGMALFRVWSGERGRGVLWAIPAATLVIMLREPLEAVAILFLVGLAWLALWGPNVGLSSKPLRWLGSISYALYLLHQNIGYVILRALNPVIGQVAGTIVTIVAIMALATAVTYVIDIPVRRLLRGRLLSPRPDTSLAPS